MVFGLLQPTESHCSAQGMTPIGQLTGENSNNQLTESGISQPPPVGLQGTGVGPLHTPPGPAGQPVEIAEAEPRYIPGDKIPVQYTGDGRTNPGAFDKSDSAALRILRPDIFDGCRFEHNKGLGQFFSVSHSLWLGSALLPTGNTYQFGTTVVLNEGRTMMLGRMSDELRLDAQIHHEIIQPQKLVARFVSSLGKSADQSVSHATLDMNGIDYNANIKVSKGPLVAMSYFQSVTPWLNMGAEAFHHSGQGVSHIFGKAMLSLNENKDIVNATTSTMGGVNISYARKVSDRVSLAAELDYNVFNNQSSMNVGYEFLLRQSKISGVISSDGTIQSQITEAIAPGFQIIFNAILNHKQDSHRFGYGVQMG